MLCEHKRSPDIRLWNLCASSPDSFIVCNGFHSPHSFPVGNGFSFSLSGTHHLKVMVLFSSLQHLCMTVSNTEVALLRCPFLQPSSPAGQSIRVQSSGPWVPLLGRGPRDWRSRPEGPQEGWRDVSKGTTDRAGVAKNTPERNMSAQNHVHSEHMGHAGHFETAAIRCDRPFGGLGADRPGPGTERRVWALPLRPARGTATAEAPCSSSLRVV